MPRYFTLDQARSHLKMVEENLRRALFLRQQHEKAEAEIEAINHRVTMMGGMVVDRKVLLGHRAKMDATANRLKESLDEIQDAGIQIKDLDIGLVDFPTLYHGEEVLLCWKLGETDIEFWHGTTEGYRGRKPIDDEFLANHRGGRLD